MIKALLKELATAAAHAAINALVDRINAERAKQAPAEAWGSTKNKPWGCHDPACNNWNYLGGALCSVCGRPKP